MAKRLIEIMESLGESRILLAGDFMLDRYLFGQAERVSPEAPVPVVRFEHEEHRLGGAGSVAADLSALGAKVRVLGVVGEDDSGREVRRRLEEAGIAAGGLAVAAGRPTVTKMRVLGSSQHRNPQQMLRLDIEQGGFIDSATAAGLMEVATRELEWASLLCVEDYNKGLLTAELMRHLIEQARARGVAVVVDPANIGDYSKYFGSTALKLNRPEAERATGLPVRRKEDHEPAARWLLEKLQLEAVVITLNEQGSFVATSDGERRWLQTRARQISDATGAGDMVLAMVAAARCAGASWTEAAALANVAGGLEVEKLGCVPITPGEIIAELLLEERGRAGKQRGLAELLAELAHHRAMGKKVVMTNGCFDILHHGHAKYFRYAKGQGDVLVVAVNTDGSIRRLKGEKRPIIEEADRLGMLEEMESIDYLITFDEDTPLAVIDAVRPEVLVKGADYSKEQVVGGALVEERGGKVVLAPLMDGKSTSGIIQRILEAHR